MDCLTVQRVLHVMMKTIFWSVITIIIGSRFLILTENSSVLSAHLGKTKAVLRIRAVLLLQRREI